MDRWAEVSHVQDKKLTSFQVRVSTLDEEARDLPKVDLLWMDGQGAKGMVLKGAPETLRRTSSDFLEVSLCDPAYRGTVLFAEIDAMLAAFGFSCVLLGTDDWSYGGNALWIRDIAQGH